MKYEMLISWRYLRAKRSSGFISLVTFISIVGVALGTASLIIALSLANGFESEVLTRIVGTFAHLRVQLYHNQPLSNYDSVSKEISSVKGVVASSPFILSKVGISSKLVQDGVLMMGIDLNKEQNVTDIRKNLKMGELNFDSTTSCLGNKYPGIVMGVGLADKMRVDIGDEVTLMSLKADKWSPGMIPKMGRFVIVGLTECGMYEYDANILYISIKDAQKLLEMKNSVTGIHAKVDDIFKSDIIGDAVQDKLGYPYFSLDWKAQNKSLFSWMKIEKMVIFSVIMMIVLIAAFNIVGSLIMLVIEKTKEIGILISMGATKKSIRKIFIYQGVFIGFIGTFLGGFLGLTLCYLQHHFNIIPLPGEIYFINSLPVMVRFWDVVIILSVANVICFLATLYPSSRAANLVPVKALRIE